MRVLRVIASMRPEGGGPAQGIRNSIPELKKLGVINEVLCFDKGIENYCSKDSFPIHYLGLGKGPYKYNKDLKTWLFNNFSNYDVVIIHGLWLYNSYGTYKAWKEYSSSHKIHPKLFVMPHGMLDPYFQKAKERKLKAIRNTIFWNLFEKRVINGVDGVLFTCDQELKLARTSFSGYNPKSELNVSYGIQPPLKIKNFEIKLRSYFPQLSNKGYLLFLSRVHQKKGVDLLINAYLELINSGYELPKLIIAGPGIESVYGKALEALSSSCNHIQFVGMVKDERKWSLLLGADAFILPSHQENFGIAIVEALACKKAVLITDKVNIYKEIIAGGAGFAESDSLEGVKKMLIKYYSQSEEEKETMKQNAYELYSNLFSITQTAKIFLSKLQN